MRTDDRSDYEAKRRQSDGNPFALLVYWGVKYHWLLTLIALFLIALGFDFKTPASFFSELRAEVRSNKASADKAIQELRETDKENDQQWEYVKGLVEGMAVRDCQNSFDKAQRALIPCSALLRDRGLK